MVDNKKEMVRGGVERERQYTGSWFPMVEVSAMTGGEGHSHFYSTSNLVGKYHMGQLFSYVS